MYVACHR